jgi:uncharacterized surface protein with fasciclin (FAS1) repeats
MHLSIIKKIISLVAIFAISFGVGSSFRTQAQTTNNIVQTASSVPEFSTLVSAIKAADLVETLSGSQSYTVLAPTNEAFAKLPSDVLSKLLLPENKSKLAKILTYHVLPGNVDSSQIVKLTSAKTVEGSNVNISIVDGKVKLNTNTSVTATDTKASNGIIHTIDSVLLPENLDLSSLSSEQSNKQMVRTGGYSAVSPSVTKDNLNFILSIGIIFITIVALAISLVFIKE